MDERDVDRGGDACTLLTFLAKFIEGADEEAAVWRLTAQANFVERQFFQTANNRLVSLLAVHGISCAYESGDVHLRHPQTNESVNRVKVKELIAALEHQLVQKNIFDYDTLVTTMVQECLNMIGALCKFIPHKELLLIRPQKIDFNGGDMVPYEVDFMGSLQTLVWPDANLFLPEHIAFLVGNGGAGYTEAKVRRDYYYKALFYPLHELVHCIQMELKQSDTTGWPTEHDASRVALIILEGLSRKAKEHNILRELLPPGKAEEVVLFVIERLKKEGKDLTSKDIADYKVWRDSWGQRNPFGLDAFESAFSRNSYTVYLKWRVGLEAYLQALVAEKDAQKRKSLEQGYADGKDIFHEVLVEVLNACLKDRTGDMTAVELVIPRHVGVTERAEVEVILRPGYEL